MTVFDEIRKRTGVEVMGHVFAGALNAATEEVEIKAFVRRLQELDASL